MGLVVLEWYHGELDIKKVDIPTNHMPQQVNLDRSACHECAQQGCDTGAIDKGLASAWEGTEGGCRLQVHSDMKP